MWLVGQIDVLPPLALPSRAALSSCPQGTSGLLSLLRAAGAGRGGPPPCPSMRCLCSLVLSDVGGSRASWSCGPYVAGTGTGAVTVQLSGHATLVPGPSPGRGTHGALLCLTTHHTEVLGELRISGRIRPGDGDGSQTSSLSLVKLPPACGFTLVALVMHSHVPKKGIAEHTAWWRRGFWRTGWLQGEARRPTRHAEMSNVSRDRVKLMCSPGYPCREVGGQAEEAAQTTAAVAPRHSSHLSPTFYAEGPEKVSDSPGSHSILPEARLPSQGTLREISLLSDQHPSGLKIHLSWAVADVTDHCLPAGANLLCQVVSKAAKAPASSSPILYNSCFKVMMGLLIHWPQQTFPAHAQSFLLCWAQSRVSRGGTQKGLNPALARRRVRNTRHVGERIKGPMGGLHISLGLVRAPELSEPQDLS